MATAAITMDAVLGRTLLAVAVVVAATQLITPVLRRVGQPAVLSALPVLARILDERELTDGRVGQLVLASASLQDAVAWLLLTVSLALASTRLADVGEAVAGLAGLAAALGLVVRPLLLAGAGVPALLTGSPPRVAGAVAVLLNTRGLVELIVLNVGLTKRLDRRAALLRARRGRPGDDLYDGAGPAPDGHRR